MVRKSISLENKGIFILFVVSLSDNSMAFHEEKWYNIESVLAFICSGAVIALKAGVYACYTSLDKRMEII